MRLLYLFITLVATSILPLPSRAEPPSRAAIAHYARHLLSDSYKTNHPGAAVLIARGGDVLFRGARGEGDMEHPKALSAGAVFEIGSITKQFTAAGVLKLAEAGKLSLDDPLSKYVKDYPNGNNITLLQLLNHTAGLKDYTEIPEWVSAKTHPDMTTAQLIDLFKNQKPEFAPGTDWRYDSSGYVLLGAVVENVTGMPWHAYLKQALFQPLGLTHTGYGSDPDFAKQLVHGYALSNGHIALAPKLSLSQAHAAGALVSTVDDLLKWNLALHEGRVLHHASYLQMITPVGKAVGQHYGFGIDHDTLRGADMLQHGGSTFGFNSYLLYLPQSRTTVAVLNNEEAEKAPRGNDAETVARRLAAYAIGQPYPEPKAIPVAPSTLKSYEGEYRIDDKTTRTVRVVNGKLTSQRAGNPRYVLIPIAKDVFLYTGNLSRIVFPRNEAGKVTGTRFFPNDEGEGQVAPRSDEPLPPDLVAITLPRAVLERVVGNYSADGMELRVFLESGKLNAQMTGQAAAELLAASPNTFFPSTREATFEFSSAQGAPPAVTLRQGKDAITFSRRH